MLELVGLRKSFYDPGRGPVLALDGIDCLLGCGVVALVGANGAGKSTLLRCLAGLMRPEAGSIRFGSIDAVARPDALRQRLGYLAAGTRLYPRLSAREMLAYAGGFLGLEGAELRLRIAMVSAQFGLEDVIDQRCAGLSTGQAQRVNLARTLLADPDLLILDEPTTGLDIVAARRVVEMVRTSRRPGRLTIVATHVLAEVDGVADRLLVMRRGRLAYDGDPAALGSGEPFAAAVQAFVGSDEAA